MSEPAELIGRATAWEPFVCERWRTERVLAATGLAAAPYLSGGEGAELVPPSFLSAQYVDAFALDIPDAPARLNGGNSCRWLADARVGDELERRSAIIGAESKSGRTGRLDVYRIETEYRRADAGERVATLGYTAIRRYPADTPSVPARPTSTSPSGEGLPPGAVHVLTTRATPRQVVSYAVATEDLYEAHYDAVAAAAAGLSGPILHGLLKLAWLTRAALEQAGPGHLVREFDVQYRGLDLVSDEFSVWVDPVNADVPGGAIRVFGGAREDAISTIGTVVLDRKTDIDNDNT